MTHAEMKTRDLLTFLSSSVTPFHAVRNIVLRLREAGYTEATGKIVPGGKYYETKNGSAVIAYNVPENARSFMIAASHSDSPSFKLKPVFSSPSGPYVRLDTERYGSGILYTWFDRPLSVAGRVVVREGDTLETRLVDIDRDLCVIPSVAIHFDRTVNDGKKINPAVDTLPLVSAQGSAELSRLVAEAARTSESAVVAQDLYVYNRFAGSLFGTENEFFLAPRIDNLMCAFATLDGFLTAYPRTAAVYAVFDNEETGSETKQGAGSLWLRSVLEKIAKALNLDLETMLRSSMLLSADNGHAVHPNHPELSDALNAPKMNGGVVIKTNASQKYATDAVSAAVFTEICRRADVPTQVFANRSDIPGGSTLGSISDTHVPVSTVDIGLAQLAMHSSCETAGTADTDHLCRAARAFYNTVLDGDGDKVTLR